MPGFLVGVGKAGDVAERSPAVISANLKEDMLLQKKLVVLNRSERSVVHQIKVDQKVMYKRFQARLTCSKLAHARLMGETQLQMQLRAKTLGTLNTDIAGNCDEDYAFLEKLEQRPCTSNSFSPIGEYKPPLWKQVEDAKPSDHFEKPPKSILTVKKGRSSSARATYRGKSKTEDTPKRKESKSDSLPSDRAPKLRPATTLGTRVENEFSRRQRDMMVQESIRSSTEGSLNKEEENGIDSSESMSSARTDTQNEDNTNESGDKRAENSDISSDNGKNKPNVAFLEHFDFDNARPKTVADITQWNTSIPTSPTSPKQISRRTSKAADFFQAEEKVDMVALRLQEAKTHDFTDHVHKFCEELEEMKCSSTRPDIDYYSMRLQMSLDQAHSKSLVEVPGTPEDENARSMGNLFVKSLTLPPIHFYTN